MKREADEAQPTPYRTGKRRFTFRSNTPPDNEADVEDCDTDEETPHLAQLPPRLLQKLEEKFSTTEGARDFIDKYVSKVSERMNLPQEELLQTVEELKALHFPEDVSLPLVISN
jgi:hypothetical protein